MKLLEQVRQTARVKHLAYRTEQAYAYWIERYIRFHGIRHHVHESAVQRAITTASRGLPWSKRVTCHTLRHSFATHLLEMGQEFARCKNCLGTTTCGPP